MEVAPDDKPATETGDQQPLTQTVTADTSPSPIIEEKRPFQPTLKLPQKYELCFPPFLLIGYDAGLKLGECLAEGDSSKVYRADILDKDLLERYPTGVCAVKKIFENSSAVITDTKNLEIFCQEISILWFFRQHKNINRILGWTDNPCSLLLFHDNLGSLETWLLNSDSSSISYPKELVRSKMVVMNLMRDICQGIKALHDAYIIHGDLKPANFLMHFDEKEQLIVGQLGDFGYARIVDDSVAIPPATKQARINQASIAYASPELIRRVRRNLHNAGMTFLMEKQGDMYAFGVSMYMIVTRLLPYSYTPPLQTHFFTSPYNNNRQSTESY